MKKTAWCTNPSFFMKIALLQTFLTLAFTTVTFAGEAEGQGILDQKISVNIKNENFKTVLRKISQEAGIRFSYERNTIPEKEKVSVSANEQSLGDIFKSLFQPYNINFEAIGKQIVLSKKELFSLIKKGIKEGNGEDEFFKPIRGNIKNAEGNPVAGASVLVRGTSRGTSTDENGNFSIDANDGDVLVVSAVGFTTYELTIGAESSYTVQLQEANTALSEVVVTALGVSKEKRKLGFAVTEIKGAEVSRANELNPINALTGKVAGVSIDQTASGSFGSARIQIRGNSTLRQNNQPIFVIDGVIIENAPVTGNRDFGNDIKNLNAEDFETVSILKGSSAAALYGSRAINGVILITTKKGRAQKGIGVTVSQSATIHNPYAGPDFQNEFGGGREPRFTDGTLIGYKPEDNRRSPVFPTNAAGEPFIQQHQGKELENWGPRFNGQQVRNYDGEWTNWVAQPDNFLDAFRNGNQTRTNVAISGGNEKSTFRFSYTNEGQRGLVAGNRADKNGFNLRATHQIAKFLSTDISVDYTQTKIRNPQNLSQDDAFSGNNFGKAFTWVIPRNYDTKYWMQREKYISQVYGGMPNMSDPTEPNHAINPDLWFYLFENNYTQDEQMLRARVSLTATITKWARFVVETNLKQ